MITLSFYSVAASHRPVDLTDESAYPFSCHTIPAEHATIRPLLVACFALALSAVTAGLPIQISVAGAVLLAFFVAAPFGAWRSQNPHATTCGYSSVVKDLEQLVGSGARGGALSPVAELVKPAWLHATRSFHSSNPETRT